MIFRLGRGGGGGFSFSTGAGTAPRRGGNDQRTVLGRRPLQFLVTGRPVFNQMVETYHLPGSELGSHQNVQKEFFSLFSSVDAWKQIGTKLWIISAQGIS